MSEIIAIVGPSGEGKSTSIETMDPKSTFVINVLGKSMPFKGWRAKYTTMQGPTDKTGNYVEMDKSPDICKVLKVINDSRPEITAVVLDDAQYVLATEFMNRALEKGFDKFAEMARNMFLILNTARGLRKDLKIFFLWHDETVSENYVPRRKIKTIGKMLDNNVTLEGMFTVVLFTKVTKERGKESTYQFVTQTEDGTTAKSPKGMFPLYIPNDLAYVAKRMDEYYTS